MRGKKALMDWSNAPIINALIAGRFFRKSGRKTKITNTIQMPSKNEARGLFGAFEIMQQHRCLK